MQWGWNGVASIFAAWAIAPGIAGCFGAILFLITKYGVLKRKDPFRAGLYYIPFYFALTSGVLTMLIVWKGGKSLSGPQMGLSLIKSLAAKLNVSKWSAGQIVGCVFGVAFGVMALCIIFFLPYLHRRIQQEDWTIKWYHIFWGPLLLRRGDVPERPAHTEIIQDYYRGHKTREELESSHVPPVHSTDEEKIKSVEGNDVITSVPSSSANSATQVKVGGAPVVVGPWYTPGNLFIKAKYYIFRGVDRDVVTEQSGRGPGPGFLTGDLAAMHARTEHFDNKTEHLYSFLQVLTAATASFTHGANDVANALGPLSAIFLIWHTGELGKKSPVPVWILVYGAAAIVIGLWTYGYNIMRNLGNRLTLHSPSRGFSMELGSALTVVMATRLAIPISTTQCITGATVGVGLCTGDIKSINWRMIAWIYFGWIVTLPVTGVFAGCLMGIILNAPQWGHAT